MKNALNPAERLTLNVKEVCELLNLSRPVVTAYIRRKDNPLPCISTTGDRRGRLVIPRAALEQWLLDEAARTGAAARR